MYNEQQKKRYLSNLDSDETKTVIRHFENASQMEEMHNKDICNFTTPEILDLYKFLFTPSINRLININRSMAKYQNWCLQQNLVNDGQNHFLEITPDVLARCINKTALNNGILTKEQLMGYIQKFENTQDKFIYLGSFEGIGAAGIDFEELRKAKFEDINEKNKTIKLITGRVIRISSELIELAREASDTYTYFQINKEKLVETSGDTIIKTKYRKNSTTSEHIMATNFYRNFRKIRDKYGISQYVSFDKLKNAGMIDYINSYAKENGLNGKQALYDESFYEELKNQYNLSLSNRTNFLKTYNDFLV